MTREAKPQEFLECRHCHRPTRKPTESITERPNTIKAHDSTGEVCISCFNNPEFVGRWLHPSMPPEEKQARIMQARRDLEALWADRRARGIDPDGIFFEGEKVIRHTPAAFTPKGDQDKAGDGEGLGMCPKGHAYTHRDSLGYRRCRTCLTENGKALAARRRAATAEGQWMKPKSELCQRGHIYTRGKNGRLHCRICENESRKVHRAERKRLGL